MQLSVGVKTHPGRKRSNNEDAYFVDESKGIFAIADGMGGHRAGEVASRLAVEEIGRFAADVHDEVTPDQLEQAFQAANRAIYLRSLDDPDCHRMGTTLLVAVVREDRLILGHAGDSRAYIRLESGMKRLTDDHSLVFRLVQERRLTEEEARTHPGKGAVYRALGMDAVVEVDLQEFPYAGEMLLLCSDGLTDMLRDPEIEAVIEGAGHPEQACEMLVQAANDAGGVDNVTVVMVQGRRQVDNE